MVKAGQPVDEMIEQLLPHLEAGDAIIECGNSLYTDTQPPFRLPRSPRTSAISASAFPVVKKARAMVPRSWSAAQGTVEERPADPQRHLSQVQRRALLRLSRRRRRRPLRQDDPQRHRIWRHADDRRSLWGDARRPGHVGPKAGANVFKEWNKVRSIPTSIEITGHVLAAVEPKTGKPLVDLILDKAGQKGTGVWSAIVAQQMGVPATAIEGAVAARSISSRKEERVAAEAVYGKREPAARPTYAWPISKRRCSPARSSPTRRASP